MDVVTHHRVCNLCEAMCGLEVTLDPSRGAGEAAVIVKPDTNDTFSKGSMCPKAPALGALHFDPDRLRYPIRKVDGDWQQISWEDAYELVSGKLKSALKTHGSDAVGTYLGNPIVHNLGMLLFVKSFTGAIGSKNVFSATSMDQLPHHFAAHYMFGHEFRIPVPDIDRTDYMIIMGANPITSNGSIMTSAGVRGRLKGIEERGGKFIVIDPRKTETAEIATEHHFIKPGRDVYFLLAFLNVLLRDDLINTGTLTRHIAGFDRLASAVGEFTPGKAAALTGISESFIERMVAEYAAQDRAVLYGRMGLSTQAHGGLCHWLINCINIASGHFDRPGGMMFPSPAIELARGTKGAAPIGRWNSRVRGLEEFYGELPVSVMAEEMATQGDGQIRAFVTICGNPVLSTPGGKRLDTLLPQMDFMVSVDNYINETTRHADVILPTPSGLEIDHYDLIFNIISVTNNVKFSKALMPVAKGWPFDWQILKELTKRVRGHQTLYERFATPRRIINLGLMLGGYGRLSHPKRWFSGLSLKKVMNAPHGISLGPLRPCVPQKLMTADGKINIAPDVFLDRLKTLGDDGEGAGIRLIGRRNVSTNNSWMHQFPKLSKSRQVRCTVMISSDDADRLGIKDGDSVQVSSRVDKIVLPAEVTDAMMPGVVSIPHGFGHTRKGTRISIAEAKPGVSVNDITDHLRVDAVTGNAAFSGQIVQIERIASAKISRLEEGKPLTILYASQTGNAEQLAHDLGRQAEEHQLIADVRNMDHVSISDLAGVERLMIVSSTYGDGEIPDTGQDLWRDLARENGDALNTTSFAVLALGDKSYDYFAQAGQLFDEKFEELGAKRIHNVVRADVDYDETANDWADAVFPILSAVGAQNVFVRAADQKRSAIKPRYNARNPAKGRLLKKHKLTGDGSTKEVMHYEIAIESDGLDYTPGDTLNVVVENDSGLVQALLTELHCSGKEVLTGYKDSLAALFTRHFEIRTPSKDLLELIGVGPIEEGSAHWGRDVLEFVRAHPSVLRNAHVLVSYLRPLAARSYSISSSHDAHEGEVHLTVASVRYDHDGRQHRGVGSTFLADRAEEGQSLGIYVTENKFFSLPNDPQKPIIMIGPGTGVAPFRAFLEQRSLERAPGAAWLLFGERQEAHDFLYRDELAAYLASGTLTRMDVAFSRDQPDKIYVQDKLLLAADDVWEWMQNESTIYVCGDASKMARDVETALLAIIAQQGAMTEKEAQTYLEKMRLEHRYNLDVY